MALWENLYWEKKFFLEKPITYLRKTYLEKLLGKPLWGKTYSFSCTAALVWSLVSSGGSRVDGVVSNRLSAIIVHRWRCPRLAPCSLCGPAKISPILKDGVACCRRSRTFM